MKQSEINMLLKEAAECLKKHNWKLPPEPEWCATDFGLGEYEKAGLVEVLQFLAPGRHARLSDFVVDALAACAGLVGARAIDWMIRRVQRSAA